MSIAVKPERVNKKYERESSVINVERCLPIRLVVYTLRWSPYLAIIRHSNAPLRLGTLG